MDSNITKYKSTTIIRILITAGANLYALNDKGGSIFLLSSFGGKKKTLEFLINSIDDQEKRDTCIWDSFAGAFGNMEIVRYIFDMRSTYDINITNNEGTSLLMAATRYNLIEVVKLLLGAEININAQNNYGWTSLMFASYYNNIEIMKLLLEREINIDAQNKDGFSALMFASYMGNTEIIKLILNSKHTTDKTKNMQNQTGFTPLMFASKKNHIDIVKLLLNSNVDKNIANNKDITSLMFASMYGHVEIVKLLLDSNLNLKERGGHTALMIASLNSHTEIVRLLLDAGADKTLTNEDGKTALNLAVTKEIQDLLK